jgi:hypothetical protein
MPIAYRVGDATLPAERPAFIAHVVNDVGAWGAGFSGALGRRNPRGEVQLPAMEPCSGRRPHGGAPHGGTGQAIRLATRFEVPVFNMQNSGWEVRLADWLIAWEASRA